MRIYSKFLISVTVAISAFTANAQKLSFHLLTLLALGFTATQTGVKPGRHT